MAYINFPHQINKLKRLRNLLQLAKQLLDSGKKVDDDTLGFTAYRRRLIGPRRPSSLPMSKQIAEIRKKSRSNQAPLITARDVRRTFLLFGFLEEDASGNFHLTPRGERIASIDPDKEPTDEEKAIWLQGLRRLKFYNATDDPKTNSPFRMRPLRVMLGLLNHTGALAVKNLVFALTAGNETTAELAQVNGVALKVAKGGKSFKKAISDAGLSQSNAADNVKILPAIVNQIGLIYRHAATATLTEFGNRILEEESLALPIWFDDIPGDDALKQCTAGTLLALASGDVQCSVIDVIITRHGRSLADVIANIQKIRISVQQSHGWLAMSQPISFDLYQDVPPAIRHAPIINSFKLLIDLGAVEVEVPEPVVAEKGKPVTKSTKRIRTAVLRKRRKPAKKTITDPDNLRREIDAEPQPESAEIDHERLQQMKELRRERNAAHQEIVAKMAEMYVQAGIESSYDNFDLLAERKGIALLHEMKTLTPDNERTQVRDAVGQLLYYETFDLPEVLENPEKTKVVKAAVFERGLADLGHIDYLDSLGILVYWIGEDGKIVGTQKTMEFWNEFLS